MADQVKKLAKVFTEIESNDERIFIVSEEVLKKDTELLKQAAKLVDNCFYFDAYSYKRNNVSVEFIKDLNKQLGFYEEEYARDLKSEWKTSTMEVIDKFIDNINKLAFNKKITIIIDNLDIIEKSKAMMLIENVVYYFGSKNILPVVCMNYNNLIKVVENKYGITAPDEYLKKYVKKVIYIGEVTKNG